MRWTPKLFYSLVVFLPTVVLIPKQINAKDNGEPQMVWLDYAEGDVKFSLGHDGAPVLGKDWLQANVGQVMENGYTLVTENGRAEIEFENGTVVTLMEVPRCNLTNCGSTRRIGWRRRYACSLARSQLLILRIRPANFICRLR